MQINGRYLKFLQNIFKRNTDNADHEALITALGGALEVVETDSNLVSKEVSLATADTEWLDEWGAIFGIARMPNETDEHLRYRILTCMDDRVSIPAIKRGIKKVLGDDTVIDIFEPYTELRYFNISTFSGHGRYPNSDYWRVGVIDITINKPITPELIRYIKQIKGAGINVAFTYTPQKDPSEVVVDYNETDEEMILSMYTLAHETQVVGDTATGETLSGTDPIRFSGDVAVYSKEELIE